MKPLLDAMRLRDVMKFAVGYSREHWDSAGLTGYGAAVLFSEDGDILQISPFKNLITDSGDIYYAKMAIALVQPANPAAPTLMTGMKVGTGSTAAAKSGAGAALVTYGTGVTANKVFDASFPVFVNLGAGLGCEGQYQTTWNAGQATVTGLTEAVIVNDASTDATSSAANTTHRAILSPTVNKGASDTLAITWNAKFLGS